MKPGSTKKILKYALIASVAVAVVSALIWIILQGYSSAWTGFADFTKPDSDFVRGKTLWDWMQLFIIPIFLSIGVFLLNRSERNSEQQRAEERAKLEREIAADRQRENALQAYFDRMTDLLLKEKLRTTQNDEVRDVARIRTLSVLRGLDAERKGMVLQFLQESGLITKEPIINLTGADLSQVNLINAHLEQANISGAYLLEANLYSAHMSGAQLSKTVLADAKIVNTDLKGANLSKAFLLAAKLTGAELTDADLSEANLSDADLRSANLSNANLINADLKNVDLSYALLTKAILAGANLYGANLNEAHLIEANLTGASLDGANLSKSELIEANLTKASLAKANLSMANLTGADLFRSNMAEANLSGATVTNEQLARVNSLEGAIMPDGTKHA